MFPTRIRQQGGALIITIPSEAAAQMNWGAGTRLDFQPAADGVRLTTLERVPRGRRTVSQILNGLDTKLLTQLHEELADDLASGPVGKEII